MIIKLTKDDFINEWEKWEQRKDNFSHNGKIALFDYLENYEEETGEKIELDIVALCCDYAEYKTALEGAQNYGYEEVVDLEPHGSVDLQEVAELEEKQAREWLEDRTQVINVEGGGVIIANF